MNIYYNPEAFGLAIFDELEGGMAWEFDKLVVWEHEKSGDLYWKTDSGCSCPTPFEGMGIHDLNTVDDWEDFKELAEQASRLDYSDKPAWPDHPALLGRVGRHLKDKAGR